MRALGLAGPKILSDLLCEDEWRLQDLHYELEAQGATRHPATQSGRPPTMHTQPPGKIDGDRVLVHEENNTRGDFSRPRTLINGVPVIQRAAGRLKSPLQRAQQRTCKQG